MMTELRMIMTMMMTRTRMRMRTRTTTTTTTMMMMTTRITTIEKETHLRLKTERMVMISDILAWRDGRTDIRTYGHTDGRTDGWTEFLPILQDFVPYRGRCPKRKEERREEKKREKKTK